MLGLDAFASSAGAIDCRMSAGSSFEHGPHAGAILEASTPSVYSRRRSSEVEMCG